MNTKKEKTALSDKVLENVTGGIGDGSSKEGGKNGGKDGGKDSMYGGICPLNGKYCKHGDISRLDGKCEKVTMDVGITPFERSSNPDGSGIITGGEKYTFYVCKYINNQE